MALGLVLVWVWTDSLWVLKSQTEGSTLCKDTTVNRIIQLVLPGPGSDSSGHVTPPPPPSVPAGGAVVLQLSAGGADDVIEGGPGGRAAQGPAARCPIESRLLPHQPGG